MADQRLSELPEATDTKVTDYHYVVQDGISKKMSNPVLKKLIHKAYNEPIVLHADGNVNDGTIRAGDYVMVRTVKPEDANNKKYIFKGFYIQGDVTDYHNASNYTPDFN